MLYRQLARRADIVELWNRVCKGLADPTIHFGPEWTIPRPRLLDTYYAVSPVDQRNEDIALVWIQAPAPTTRTFGMGLFEEWRGRRLGPLVRDTALEICFHDPVVWKTESETYGSNLWSLRVLHERHPRTKPEGIQRATIKIGETYYDRHLYGLTREEWEAGLL
jgi:RimJ/RimL family protein N-acetyltransferase